MRFFAGLVTALIVIVAAAALAAWTFDIAASVPDTAVEFKILHSIMRNSVRMRAGTDERETWSEEEVRKGFKDYDEMCIVCHSAPGRERRPISNGMRPQPPDLAETSKQWTSAQLFWIIKNGIKMTGMPAFGSSHNDEQIWSIVGFVRRLPQISPNDFRSMESKIGSTGEHEGEGHHQ
jgi:mono/diheme cytochrome c family protein